MATYSYKPGLGAAGAYQVAGTPYVSGNIDPTHAEIKLDFPGVTQWVVVQNPAGADLKVAFSSNGLKSDKSYYFTLPASTVSPRFEVKATQLFLSGGAAGVSVMAGLTSIDTITIDNASVSPSGSNWSGSLGALVG